MYQSMPLERVQDVIISNFNGSSTERFLSIDGVDRRYQVRLPIDYDPSQAYPMLFYTTWIERNR